MIAPKPTERDREIARKYVHNNVGIADMLAEAREELLRQFEALANDFAETASRKNELHSKYPGEMARDVAEANSLRYAADAVHAVAKRLRAEDPPEPPEEVQQP